MKLIIKNKNIKGFSLLEVILYLSLLIIVIGGIVSFMYTMIETNTKTKTISTVNKEATHVLDFITQSIRNSKSVNVINNGTSSLLSLETFDSPNSPLSFYLANETLMLSSNNGGDIPLTSSSTKMTDLKFDNVSVSDLKKSIRISFRLDSKTIQIIQEYNYGKNYEAFATPRN